MQAVDVVEKRGGFGRGKAQVGGAQFRQLATSAPACQGRRGILAGGENQVYLRGQMLNGIRARAWSTAWDSMRW